MAMIGVASLAPVPGTSDMSIVASTVVTRAIYSIFVTFFLSAWYSNTFVSGIVCGNGLSIALFIMDVICLILTVLFIAFTTPNTTTSTAKHTT